VEMLARWEGVERLSRSKSERIINKNAALQQSDVVEDKKILCGRPREWEREYRETILLLSRARGLLDKVSFFCLIIGFKGFKLYNY
jgi:hypothetical protein